MATVESTPANDTEDRLPREEFIAILQAQPADSTREELLRQLAMQRLMDRGVEDLEAGRTMTHEEVGKRIASW